MFVFHSAVCNAMNQCVLHNKYSIIKILFYWIRHESNTMNWYRWCFIQRQEQYVCMGWVYMNEKLGGYSRFACVLHGATQPQQAFPDFCCFPFLFFFYLFSFSTTGCFMSVVSAQSKRSRPGSSLEIPSPSDISSSSSRQRQSKKDEVWYWNCTNAKTPFIEPWSIGYSQEDWARIVKEAWQHQSHSTYKKSSWHCFCTKTGSGTYCSRSYVGDGSSSVDGSQT